MKKLVLSSILMVIMVLSMSMVVYANPTSDYATRTDYMDEFEDWTNETVGGRELVVSAPALINDRFIEIEIANDWTYFDKPFVYEAAYSEVLIYDDALESNLLFTYDLNFEDSEHAALFILEDGEWIKDFEDYVGNYMVISLKLHEDMTSSNIYDIVTAFNDSTLRDLELSGITATGQSYGFEVNVAGLPETEGNPYEEGTYGEVIEWHYDEVTDEYFAEFTYLGSTYLFYVDVEFSSTDFLDGVEDAVYYSYDGDLYFHYMYQEDDVLYYTDGDELSKRWTGYATWNITTGEIIMVNRGWVLTYIDVLDNRDAFAYFYMPDIPVDELLTVSLVTRYRYMENNYRTLWRNQWGDYEKLALTLQHDETTLGALPEWVKDNWAYGISAISVGLIMTMFPEPTTTAGGVALISTTYASLFAGGILLNSANVGAINHLINGRIDQIARVQSPTQVLTNTINDHYTLMAGETVTVDPDVDPLYRLYLGSFNKSGTVYVDIDYSKEEYKYTELVWMTEGEVYSMTESYIDSDTIVDLEYQAEEPEEDESIFEMLMIPILVIGFMFIGIKGNILNNPKQLIILVILFGSAMILLGIW